MLPIYKRLDNYLMMPVIALNICHFDEANLADHLGLHQTPNLQELGEHMVQETLKKIYKLFNCIKSNM